MKTDHEIHMSVFILYKLEGLFARYRAAFLFETLKVNALSLLQNRKKASLNPPIQNITLQYISCTVSSLLLIDFYFSVSRNKFLLSFQLTFSLLFSPLISLFTFVRCEYRAQCFFFSLFLPFFVSCA